MFDKGHDPGTKNWGKLLHLTLGLKVMPRKILGVVGLHNLPGLFSAGPQVLDGAIQLLSRFVKQGDIVQILN